MEERLLDGEIRKEAVRLGISTEKELDGIANGWMRWSDMEDASFGMMHGEILIRN
jgi:hypothetical protein